MSAALFSLALVVGRIGMRLILPGEKELGCRSLYRGEEGTGQVLELVNP